ncbi:MAG: WbqC family protein [Bacteroidota bacterium]
MSNLVLPTSYLPCRAYFSHVKSNSEITIEIYESFQKQSSRNRAFIYTSNGIQTLSIPLSSRKNHQLTKDITIDYTTRWQDIHWRAIESAYNSSPFFLYYKDELFTLLYKQEKFLIDFNLNLLNWLLKKIKIKSMINYSQNFENLNTNIVFQDLTQKQYKSSLLNNYSDKQYVQVFQAKHGYIDNLSCIDLLFNEGPNTISLI